jgi:hypothetical protein
MCDTPTGRLGKPTADTSKGAAGNLAYMQLSPPSGTYALRSAASSSTASPSANPVTHPKAGWHKDFHQLKKEVTKAVDSLPGASLGRKEARGLHYKWELKQKGCAHVVQLHQEQVNIVRQMLHKASQRSRAPSTTLQNRKFR